MARPLSTSSSVPLSELLPKSSWDSHMHIADLERFPISASAVYKPHAALLSAAQANASKISLPNLVLVQTSTYGTDNSCLLHHLDLLCKQNPNAARGVVVIDPTASVTEGGVSDEELRQWHQRGIRGVRINLKSVGQRLDRQQMRETLGGYAKRLQKVGGEVGGWAIQVFLDLEDIPLLEEFASEYLGSGEQGAKGGIKLVIDHLGSPAVIKSPAHSMPGFNALLALLKNPAVWVKVSGYYRTKSPSDGKPSRPEEWEEAVKELLATRGGKGLVFASDWPHTRFEGWEIEPWIRACSDWTGSGKERTLLFRDNARHLWNVQGQD